MIHWWIVTWQKGILEEILSPTLKGKRQQQKVWKEDNKRLQTSFSQQLQDQGLQPSTLQLSTLSEGQEDFVRSGLQEEADALPIAKGRLTEKSIKGD